jgi:sulfite reductase alpha subunit-like flavoprotein
MQVGDTVAVYTSKNPDFRLPHRPEAPIIMVGPGTGVAPFRAFIQHRQLCVSEATPRPGPALLFFGCRRRDQDFLYRDLLEGWDSTGAVQLQTAFSREGSRKVNHMPACQCCERENFHLNTYHNG